MKKRKRAEEAMLFAFLMAADLSAGIFIRHEDRVVRAVIVRDADRKAAEYAGTLEELAEQKQWIAIDAFAQLHELRESGNALYEPYMVLMKACGEYEWEIERRSSESESIKGTEKTMLFTDFKDGNGEFLSSLSEEEKAVIESMEERILSMEEENEE